MGPAGSRHPGPVPEVVEPLRTLACFPAPPPRERMRLRRVPRKAGGHGRLVQREDAWNFILSILSILFPIFKFTLVDPRACFSSCAFMFNRGPVFSVSRVTHG